MINEALRENPNALQDDVDVMQAFMGQLFASDDIEVSQEQRAEFMARPEMQFFMLVWVPCWVKYDMYATQLYRQARLGDQQSLERLLRLDKRVVANPAISKHVARTVNEPDQDSHYILKALANPPMQPGNKELRRQVKGWLGGLVLYLSRILSEKREQMEAYMGCPCQSPCGVCSAH